MKKLTKMLLLVVMTLVVIAGVFIMKKYNSMIISDIGMFFHAEEIKYEENYIILDNTYDKEINSEVDTYIPLNRINNEIKAIVTVATLGLAFCSCGITLLEKTE